MMKKMFTAMAIAAAMTAVLSIGTLAAEAEKVEAGGLVFEIPGEFKDLVTVQTEGLPAGTLISVSETASIEASKALGENYDGAGWLFSISRAPEPKVKEMRCGDMSGIEIFAEDDDMCYMFEHPTDVRLVRESNEEMTAATEQWTQLTEWASADVRETTLLNNPQLDPEFYSNTDLDILLARAAYMGDVNYEIRSLEFGTLNPSVYGVYDGLEDLTEDVTFRVVDDLPEEEQPDGEYIVLAFDDENVQYDFFLGQGMGNYVREVRTFDDGETMETLYEATFTDPGKTATGEMKEWAASIMHSRDGGDYIDDDRYDDYDDYDDADDFFDFDD